MKFALQVLRSALLTAHRLLLTPLPLLTAYCLLLTPCCSLAQPVGRAGLAFDRYDIILDRKPFGDETLAAAAGAAGTTPPPGAFINVWRMSAIVKDDETGQVRVGLTDLRSGRNYWLGIGPDRDTGIDIVQADYDEEKARIRKDTEDYWVSMKGGTTVVTIATGDVPAAPPPPAAASPRASNSEAAPPSVTPPLLAGERDLAAGMRKPSYAERKKFRDEIRRRRRDQMEQASARTGGKRADTGLGRRASAATNKVEEAEESASAEGTNGVEEIDEAMLQQYQMQLIREGRKPLPIPLSPEADDELVKEGVLPPSESEQ